MKAAFGVEAVGYGLWLELRMPLAMVRAVGAEEALGTRSYGSHYRPWLAQVTGTDPRYGLARQFVRARIDYRGANSRATRGAWFWWTLDEGLLYETRYLSAWSRQEHRFLTASGGDVRDVTGEEALAWASGISAQTS